MDHINPLIKPCFYFRDLKLNLPNQLGYCVLFCFILSKTFFPYPGSVCLQIYFEGNPSALPVSAWTFVSNLTQLQTAPTLFTYIRFKKLQTSQ